MVCPICGKVRGEFGAFGENPCTCARAPGTPAPQLERLPPDKYQLNVPFVIGAVIEGIRRRGDHPERVAGDHEVVMLRGRRVPMRFVTVPVHSGVWRDMSNQGLGPRRVTVPEAVQLIRQSFLHVQSDIEHSVLGLDATPLGNLVGPPLVEAYRLAHRDPEREFLLVEAWLVGANGKAYRFGGDWIYTR